jgi:hypothetical protein
LQPGRLDVALGAVGRAMRRLRAPWYVFGGQAVALHGAPRATEDIDVTVLAEASTPAVLAALRAEGIIPRVEDAGFIATSRVIPSDHRASGWKLDVVLGGPGLEELIAAGSVKRRVGRVVVPLLRLEHLLILKVLAYRPRDIADVSRLLAVNGARVDLAEVRELLAALEEAVAEGGLVARFDRILEGTLRSR